MMEKANRYGNLIEALDTLQYRGVQHLRYLEVGTYNGVRAGQLLENWLGRNDRTTATYYGFDLFAVLSEEMRKTEFSKSKPTPPRDVARENILFRLKFIKHAVKRCDINLFQGNTRETLPKVCSRFPEMSLIFIDGGHSLETIRSDWNAVKNLMGFNTVVLFDDFYEGRDDVGCLSLIRELSDASNYCVEKLGPVDHVDSTGLDIRMIKVTLAS